ncbi:MAG: ABC transporter substrate-binding protein [Hyphomicrobiaceae bacterium]|nr:MAG: ABC transporter substrate-binding protein [Hyphomicrobiaceae bacterium]
MPLRKANIALLAALAAAVPWMEARAQDGLFIPGLVYRTGPYAPNGIPIANGFKDYFNLLNERDNGIEGVKIIYEECETQYDTKLGVECYERLKTKNALIINPYSTGITYALIPKAPVDKIPILSMGYGRTDAAVGSIHPWVFVTPTGYWSQLTAKIKYIASREGGLDKLKGKKIVNIYHNSPYGKETIPILDVLAKKHGFVVEHLAVDHPGQEQKATWLKVRQSKPDWIIFRGWGVMNQVGVKEAAAIGFPMDHIVAVWWSGTETDVLPAGDGAKNYISATFHAPGKGFKIHQDLKTHIYDKNKGATKWEGVGEVLYNRGLVNAMITAEAIRWAVKKHGKKVTGEHVREGMENLDLTQARLDALGFGQMMRPIKVSCDDHEGKGGVIFQQWTGKEWKLVSDWIEPMHDVVRPMMEASAQKFAAENKVTPRACK